MAYELKLDAFKGPLDALLELVESRHLDINEISLAAVTDDFLSYIERLPEKDLPLIADFISVASRLILIKSKSLLPELPLTAEEEADVKDLEERLVAYRRLREAMRQVSKIWSHGRGFFGRRYLETAAGAKVFYPGKNFSGKEMTEALIRLTEEIQKFSLESQTIREVVISLEEKIKEVISRIADLGETSFKKLSGSKTREEIIVVFLAILHLARERLVSLEQGKHFGEILVRSKDK